MGTGYSGLITSIAVFFWTVSVVSLVAVAYTSSLAGRSAAAHSFGICAAIVLLLLLDDLFLLHSSVVPSLVGGPKWGLVVLEAIAVVMWLTSCRAEIVRTRWELLIASAAGFVVSLAIDQFPPFDERSALVLEDGAKLLAVLSLATWSVSTGADLIASVVRRVSHPDDAGRREESDDLRDVVV